MAVHQEHPQSEVTQRTVRAHQLANISLFFYLYGWPASGAYARTVKCHFLSVFLYVCIDSRLNDWPLSHKNIEPLRNLLTASQVLSHKHIKRKTDKGT